jgi:PAS domain-containing protein
MGESPVSLSVAAIGSGPRAALTQPIGGFAERISRRFDAPCPGAENLQAGFVIGKAEVESFRKHLGPFVVAAETTRMAMVFTDATKPDNPIIFANDSLLSLIGYDREEVLGKSFNFLMAHGADAEALTRIKAEFEGSSSSGAERGSRSSCSSFK